LSLTAMLEDLPKACSMGVTTSSTGYNDYWRGY
jgi:hypothetical protein